MPDPEIRVASKLGFYIYFYIPFQKILFYVGELVYFYICSSYHAFDDLAKDNVLVIQPSGPVQKDEKLRAVGIFTVIGHSQVTGSLMTD